MLAHDNEVFNGGLADYSILLENTAVIKISDGLPVAVDATISCAHATVMGAVRVAGEISGKSADILTIHDYKSEQKIKRRLCAVLTFIIC